MDRADTNKIQGVDYHPSVQQIAWADTETGECGERRLKHSNPAAEQFYHELKQRGVNVRVGIEASGHDRWFQRLLAELDFEFWVGDAAQIRAMRIRKQKTDRRDAQLMTHPGVGPITALAFVLILGTPERFHCGKQLGSYLGLIPCEDSSADSHRLGHITKQGNTLLRFLLVEAAQGGHPERPTKAAERLLTWVG